MYVHPSLHEDIPTYHRHTDRPTYHACLSSTRTIPIPIPIPILTSSTHNLLHSPGHSPPTACLPACLPACLHQSTPSYPPAHLPTSPHCPIFFFQVAKVLTDWLLPPRTNEQNNIHLPAYANSLIKTRYRVYTYSTKYYIGMLI